MFFLGGGFNEIDSVHTRIPQGAVDHVIEIPRANYASFRFDIEQDVVLKGIYSENELPRVLPYHPNVIRIIFLALEAFALLFMLVSCISKMCKATAEEIINQHQIDPTVLLCNLAFALTIFVFQPLIVACENNLLSVNTWWKQLLCMGGVTAILTWLMSLLKPQDGKIAASVSLGIAITVAIQGFLFNEGRLLGLQNSHMLNIVYWIGIVVITVAMVADRLQKEEKKRTAIAMRVAAWVLILFQAVNLTVLSTNHNNSNF